jgi:hypothetical protein
MSLKVGLTAFHRFNEIEAAFVQEICGLKLRDRVDRSSKRERFLKYEVNERQKLISLSDWLSTMRSAHRMIQQKKAASSA